MARLNCWEATGCGREPGGAKARETGVCPAAVDLALFGTNGGACAGRACWVVAGTFAPGPASCARARDLPSCLVCGFYRRVVREQRDDFVNTRTLLAWARKGTGGTTRIAR
ncbi:MAG: hypothetical protein MUC63_02155 [Planctomycetes bacterium]|jgi:hypothetical protein|nr:hypothetical protein [Planctomycetota bacterium]